MEKIKDKASITIFYTNVGTEDSPRFEPTGYKEVMEKFEYIYSQVQKLEIIQYEILFRKMWSEIKKYHPNIAHEIRNEIIQQDKDTKRFCLKKRIQRLFPW